MDLSGVSPVRSIFDVQRQVERELREAASAAVDRDRLIRHELAWRGRPEWEIRQEMEAAVHRRHPGGVTWPVLQRRTA